MKMITNQIFLVAPEAWDVQQTFSVVGLSFSYSLYIAWNVAAFLGIRLYLYPLHLYKDSNGLYSPIYTAQCSHQLYFSLLFHWNLLYCERITSSRTVHRLVQLFHWHEHIYSKLDVNNGCRSADTTVINRHSKLDDDAVLSNDGRSNDDAVILNSDRSDNDAAISNGTCSDDVFILINRCRANDGAVYSIDRPSGNKTLVINDKSAWMIMLWALKWETSQ